MDLGEEYRWNVPVVTYGFDPSFVNYFGTNGVAEVEKAIQMLNGLPPASLMDLQQFPVSTVGKNHEADTLNLSDLKSTALSFLLEAMGLAAPEQYVWNLHDYSTGSIDNRPYTNFTVIRRNFDPEYWSATPYVNDVYYTYEINFYSYGLDYWDASEMSGFGLFPFSSVAGGTLYGSQSGEYFKGLTRDDAGGLRYLFSRYNWNIGSLLPGTRGYGTNAGNFVDTALRPGVEKITLERVHFNSMLGGFTPVTNRYVDTYIVNDKPVKQTLERVITRPDILFAASDFMGASGYPSWVQRTDTRNWINNAALNSYVPQDGPGVIQPPITISFNKLAGYFMNYSGYYYYPGRLGLDEAGAINHWFWGSFDESTNAPVVYPVGFNIPITATVRLPVLASNPPRDLNWQLSAPVGARFRLESSTNLRDWSFEQAFSITGSEVILPATPGATLPLRFYRIRWE